jgi:1-acyl-sn-glycerol-3-phosphate acyltransferase
VIPKPISLGVKFGEPLDFSRYAGMENDRVVLRSITDEIIYSIMDLSGQEYVDEYAATVKARIAAQKAAAKRASEADDKLTQLSEPNVTSEDIPAN